jgi:hypothetical protein
MPVGECNIVPFPLSFTTSLYRRILHEESCGGYVVMKKERECQQQLLKKNL